MKVIVDISEELYKSLLNGYEEPYSRQFSDCIRNSTPLEEELKKIYEEVSNAKFEIPIISRGYECYGLRPKTPQEIRTEILDIIYEHIKENNNDTTRNEH